MRYSKWHAHGNAYLLVEPDEVRLTQAEVRRASADAGADGVLEVLEAHETEAAIAIWNADGSLAEMSGNGTRIAARWLAERTGADAVRIRVGSRVVVARRRPDGRIEQDLGEVQVGAPELLEGIEVVPVSVGNPHAVVEGDPADITHIGPLLETHPRFPERTNVQVVRVETPGHVAARVWERGVGETPSSGTSAVAVAAATHGDGEVAVVFPGGRLDVHLVGGRALVTGPAERLA